MKCCLGYYLTSDPVSASYSTAAGRTSFLRASSPTPTTPDSPLLPSSPAGEDEEVQVLLVVVRADCCVVVCAGLLKPAPSWPGITLPTHKLPRFQNRKCPVFVAATVVGVGSLSRKTSVTSVRLKVQERLKPTDQAVRCRRSNQQNCIFLYLHVIVEQILYEPTLDYFINKKTPWKHCNIVCLWQKCDLNRKWYNFSFYFETSLPLC